MDIKTEPTTESQPIFSNYVAHAGQLGNLFNTSFNSEMNESSDENDEEDCVMIGAVVPRPLASTSEGIIKREGDVISNNIGFIVTVGTFFM